MGQRRETLRQMRAQQQRPRASLIMAIELLKVNIYSGVNVRETSVNDSLR